MKTTTGAFRHSRLEATVGDIAYLRSTAAAVEKNVMANYEEFLYYDSRRVDESKWKAIKTHRHIHTYKERRKCMHEDDGIAVMSPEPQAILGVPSSTRRILATGIVPGNIDDAMFGCSFQDTPSLRATEAYQHSNIDDCSVLMKIDGPTLRDPYRFLGLTWHVKNSLLSKRRDMLLLQHTHLTTLRSGERVGVSLRHSVKHRDLPQLQGYSTARSTVSSVTIYRQYNEDHMEVFGIELLDDKQHHRPDAMHRHDVTRDLRKTAKVGRTGFLKKLHWLLQQQHQAHQVAVMATTDSERKQCAVCTKSTKRVVFATGGAACQLCAKHVCSSCTTTHNIILDASSPQVVTKSFGICHDCIHISQQVSTKLVVEEQILSTSRSGLATAQFDKK